MGEGQLGLPGLLTLTILIYAQGSVQVSLNWEGFLEPVGYTR